jgi:F-type H+-transporting ATPase subunit epsilon
MADMTCELVSPERVVWTGPATYVFARSLDGDLGVLPRHAPLLAALDYGVVRIRPVDGSEIAAPAHGGFLSVSPDEELGTKVSILAETAVMAADIDVAAARSAVTANEGATSEDADRFAALKSAQARVRAAEALSAAH